MAIRPIDLQVMVPKTAEFSKQQHGEVNKHNVDQQMFTQSAAKEAEHKQTMVIETNESERFVDKDGRNKQEQQGRQGKKKQGGGEDKEKSKEGKTGTGLFDMRI